MNSSTSRNDNTSKKEIPSRSRSNAVKEKKQSKTSSLKETEKLEKYRSGSLSRPNQLKIQESPRKATSLDRNISNKNNLKDAVKIAAKSSTKRFSTVDNVKITKPVTNSKKDSHRSHVTTTIPKVKKEKSKLAEKPLRTLTKASKPKTNAQIAKSFVHSSQNKSKLSTRSPRTSKEVSQKDKSSLPFNEVEHNNLERPRTSTIRKGHTDSLNATVDLESNEDGNASFEMDQPRPKSRSDLSAHSDSDRASYEEDFEDYDSDFEASASESISESDYSEEGNFSNEDEFEKQTDIQTAANPMPELKQPVIMSKRSAEKTFLKMSDRSSLFSEKKSSSVEDNSMKLSRSFINFESDLSQNEEISKKKELNESSNRLKSLKTELDINKVMVTFQENYKNAGKSSVKQVSIQTENYEEEEIQTEEIEFTDKWTQNPSNGTTGFGGDQISTKSNISTAWKNLFYVNSTKLSKFLQRSSNIILTLLEEEFISSETDSSMRQSDLMYCSGYFAITPPGFLSGVPVISVSSAFEAPYIITVHGDLVQLPCSENKDEKGIICVWNIFQSSNPEYILTANSQPTCGTFGPNGSDVVIGGMVDGAIILWDLSDLVVKNIHLESGDDLCFRPSTYNTAVALGTENHCSCIVGIQSVYKSEENNWQSSGLDRLKSFHVLTLEDMGVINIWVVVEVLTPDISGLESDLGLAPGGKFRLVKSACLILHSLPSLQLEQRTSIRTFDFRLVPHDSSKILVTTDAGIILHVTRHSGFAEPRYYHCESGFNSEIRCIDCSPHNDNLFLVGCSDGSIKLYNIKLVRPVLEFLQSSKGEPVTLIQWSVVDPSVFCVLTSHSHLHLYNLMEDLVHPLYSNNFEDCKITWFVFKKQKIHSNETHFKKFSSNLIIAKESGDIEVHKLQDMIKQDYEMQYEYMKNL